MNFVKRAMAAVAVSAFVMAPQASSQELTHGVGTSPSQTHVAGLEMVESGGGALMLIYLSQPSSDRMSPVK